MGRQSPIQVPPLGNRISRRLDVRRVTSGSPLRRPTRVGASEHGECHTRVSATVPASRRAKRVARRPGLPPSTHELCGSSSRQPSWTPRRATDRTMAIKALCDACRAHRARRMHSDRRPGAMRIRDRDCQRAWSQRQRVPAELPTRSSMRWPSASVTHTRRTPGMLAKQPSDVTTEDADCLAGLGSRDDEPPRPDRGRHVVGTTKDSASRAADCASSAACSRFARASA